MLIQRGSPAAGVKWLLFAEQYGLVKLAAQVERYLAGKGKVLGNIDGASNISPNSLLRILDRRYEAHMKPRGL